MGSLIYFYLKDHYEGTIIDVPQHMGLAWRTYSYAGRSKFLFVVMPFNLFIRLPWKFYCWMKFGK